ncbi:MAG: small basic protein [Candidatus Omnitrophota bacterium]|nr:small basic protein [Candidatus Omnitrophota bacterium]
MSIHPSLNISEKDKKQRSVLKRSERLKMMLEKGQWKEGEKVYGLPKIKTIRIKIKKEKAEKAAEGVPADGAAPAAAQPAETKAPAKGASSKGQEKK